MIAMSNDYKLEQCPPMAKSVLQVKKVAYTPICYSLATLTQVNIVDIAPSPSGSYDYVQYNI